MSDRDGFSTVQRVRFGDLDALGHLNNVEFLRLFETARVDFVAHVAPADQPGKVSEFTFILAECHIHYRSQAHWDEEIRTWIRPAELKRASFKLTFEMRAERDDRLVAEGFGVMVTYDLEAGRTIRVPHKLRARLEPLLAR
ncbi:MAG: acyl-CoA thioesterase [Actinomycetota bacterium]|nr:acyl-CoA thioesterase [Actinomycetota bacterium]